jgi:GDP-D-mannose dehydratase
MEVLPITSRVCGEGCSRMSLTSSHWETGEGHSVQNLVEASFKHALDWHDHVIIDPLYYRLTEIDFLLADVGKA